MLVCCFYREGLLLIRLFFFLQGLHKNLPRQQLDCSPIWGSFHHCLPFNSPPCLERGNIGGYSGCYGSRVSKLSISLSHKPTHSSDKMKLSLAATTFFTTLTLALPSVPVEVVERTIGTASPLEKGGSQADGPGSARQAALAGAGISGSSPASISVEGDMASICKS